MNGLSRHDNRIPEAPEEVSKSEQLDRLLRQTSRDTKVIFGATRGIFDLNRNQVENFFHLVDQRVKEQNHPSSFICEVSVYYNDGSSRKFPSISDFGNYSETRNRFPTVITLHFAYFIQFPDGEAPEKQELDIVIRSSESISETIDMVENDSQMRMSGDKVQVMDRGNSSPFGSISYNISHSRVSWGLDIEGHVKSHIDSILDQPTISDKILRLASGPLNLFTTVFVGLYCVNFIIDAFFAFLYRSDGAGSPEAMLLVASEYLVNGHIAKYIVATLVVSVIFFVIFSNLISRLTKSLRKPRPSFIILDDADERRKIKKLAKFERRWWSLCVAVTLDIIVAILVFFLEDRISQLFQF